MLVSVFLLYRISGAITLKRVLQCWLSWSTMNVTKNTSTIYYRYRPNPLFYASIINSNKIIAVYSPAFTNMKLRFFNYRRKMSPPSKHGLSLLSVFSNHNISYVFTSLRFRSCVKRYISPDNAKWLNIKQIICSMMLNLYLPCDRFFY